MGHTLTTATQLVQEFETECRPFARALRREDQEFLRDLLAMIYYNSAPIAYAGSVEPFQLFVLSMGIGILKQVNAIKILLSRHPELARELQDLTQ